MYLNKFAPSVEALDMTDSEEFESLCSSASELGLVVPERSAVRYASRNVVVNGLRLHLLEWGDPASPDVVLLHGGNQSAHSWDLVSLTLAPRYHVVAIDQRGHGDTEWPRDGEIGHHNMASDARGVIDLLGLDHPIVMGHSMGGIVTMTLLIANPGLGRKAVFVDIAPQLPDSDGQPSIGSQRIREFVRSAREFDSIDEFVDRVVDYDPFRSREHIRRTLIYNLMQRNDGKYVSKNDSRRALENRASNAPATAPMLPEVAAIECPALIVRGAESDILMPDHAECFAETLPQGRLVTVADCGHNVHSQNTAGFLAVVVPFIDEARPLS